MDWAGGSASAGRVGQIQLGEEGEQNLRKKRKRELKLVQCHVC